MVWTVKEMLFMPFVFIYIPNEEKLQDMYLIHYLMF